jgi:transposase
MISRRTGFSLQETLQNYFMSPENGSTSVIHDQKEFPADKKMKLIDLSLKMEEEKEIILKEKKLSPYWTPQTGENSKRLWLPKKDDCIELDSIQSFPMQKSWFSTKVTIPTPESWREILSQPLQLSLEQSIEDIKTDKEELTTMKVRIFPTAKERKQLKRWFGMGRYVYNNGLVCTKVLTEKNPLNALYNEEEKRLENVQIKKCTSILKSGNRKGEQCGNTCEGEFCKKHTKKERKENNEKKEDLPDVCSYMFRSGKQKGQSCNAGCKGKFCRKHLNIVNNTNKVRKTIGKSNKISNISVRMFLEKIHINDKVEFFTNTKEQERKDILKDFLNTLNDPKYMYDENRKEKTWITKWCKKFPEKMFRGMTNLLTQDINSCLSNGNLKLDIRLKTKKDKQYILNADQWNAKTTPFPSELSGIKGFYKIGRKMIDLKSLIDDIKKDDKKRNYQIMKDEFGKYWLNMPVSPDFFLHLKERTKGMNHETQVIGKPFKFCSLDPGVRTFQTLYGLNHIVEIGRWDCLTLIRLLEKEDIIRSKIATYGRKRKFKKRLDKIRRRLKNIVDELHRKTISFLVSNYETILLPSFETAEMVKKKTLNHKTKREMLAFRFYVFKQRLKEKCFRKHVDLRIVSEAYTSKCCCGCGKLVDVGSSKTFKCDNPECQQYGVKIDRDFNGGRNIALRNLQGALWM